MCSTCRSYRKIHLVLHSKDDHSVSAGHKIQGRTRAQEQDAGARDLGNIWSSDFPIS